MTNLPTVTIPHSALHAALASDNKDQTIMPDHLTTAARNEIELLLLRIFRQDTEAIRFLSSHNHSLRAKPLDLIQRDLNGVSQVLAYLRQAAANSPPSDAITRLL